MSKSKAAPVASTALNCPRCCVRHKKAVPLVAGPEGLQCPDCKFSPQLPALRIAAPVFEKLPENISPVFTDPPEIIDPV